MTIFILFFHLRHLCIFYRVVEFMIFVIAANLFLLFFFFIIERFELSTHYISYIKLAFQCLPLRYHSTTLNLSSFERSWQNLFNIACSNSSLSKFCDSEICYFFLKNSILCLFFSSCTIIQFPWFLSIWNVSILMKCFTHDPNPLSNTSW